MSQEEPPEAAGFFRVRRPGQHDCRLSIPVENTYWIGRATNSDIRIDECSVSRSHVRVFSIAGYETVPHMVYIRDESSNWTTVTRRSATGTPHGDVLLLKSQDDPLLLEHGDVIRICQAETTLEFIESGHNVTDVISELTDLIQHREIKYISKWYDISPRTIGHGGQGKICLASQKVEGTQLACKIVDLRQKRVGREEAIRQAEMVKDLTHPNIIGMVQVFYSEYTIYEFQELLTAGDLHSYYESCRGKVHHVEVAVIIRQILRAVEHLHANHVVHRDLKPENILMASLTPGSRVVVTDFGLCHYEPGWAEALPGTIPRIFDSDVKGTPKYTAPEVYACAQESLGRPGYTAAVDLWSIGVIAAILLTGHEPFGGTEKLKAPTTHAIDQYLEHIRDCLQKSRATDGQIWNMVPDRPKDLVSNLLTLSDTKRPTATQALQHEWFTHDVFARKFDSLWWWASKDLKSPRRPGAAFVHQIDPRIHAQAIPATPVRRMLSIPATIQPSVTLCQGLSASKRQRSQWGPPLLIPIAKDASCDSDADIQRDHSQALLQVEQQAQPRQRVQETPIRPKAPKTRREYICPSFAAREANTTHLPSSDLLITETQLRTQETVSSIRFSQIPPTSFAAHAHTAFPSATGRQSEDLINTIPDSSPGHPSPRVQQDSEVTTQVVSESSPSSPIETQLPAAQSRSQSQYSLLPNATLHASSLAPSSPVSSPRRSPSVARLPSRIRPQLTYANRGKKRDGNGCLR